MTDIEKQGLLECLSCGNEQIATWSYLLTPPEAYQWRCGCPQCGLMSGIRAERREAVDALLGELKEIPSIVIHKYPDGSELTQLNANATFKYYQELINMKKKDVI